MKNGILQTKSEAFSTRIVNMKNYLQKVYKEFEMSGQVVRSGTSIGANIAEAFCAESDQDFIHKLQISLKEASETHHWLVTLHNTKYITAKQFDSIHADCEELIRLLTHTINKKRKSISERSPRK